MSSPSTPGGPAANIINTNVSTDFMSQCFFIFDDLNENEKALDEELMLFFHPPTVSLNLKLFLSGSVCAMVAFAKSFLEHPLEIAKMERCKLAIKQIGNITMVLSGAADDPDSTLTSQLDLLYTAFRFYNRSFPSVIEKSRGSRKELLKEMGRIGKEQLLPLIIQCFHKNLLSSFNALPYTPLPHKANRCFIQASQLLNSIKMDSNNLSGCIIYKNSVVCTHLDVQTTRWILNHLENKKASTSASFVVVGSPFSSPRQARVDPRNDLFGMYMLRKEVDQFTSERDNMFPPWAAYSNSPPPSPAPRRSNNPYDGEEEEVDGYVQLGLYIVSLNELSCATVMKHSAMYDKEHMKKLSKLILDSKLAQLEVDLDSACQSVNQQTMMYNARTMPALGYHLITYDSQTEIATSSSITTPTEFEFAQTASAIHHTFSSDSIAPPHSQVSQVIVKNGNGEIFGRKVFGREVYFQYRNGNNLSHDKFLEGIEKTVRTTLKDEHNINIL